jgi:hypothetical protein
MHKTMILLLCCISALGEIDTRGNGYWQAYRLPKGKDIQVFAHNLSVWAEFDVGELFAASDDHEELFLYLCERGFSGAYQRWYTHHGEPLDLRSESCKSPQFGEIEADNAAVHGLSDEEITEILLRHASHWNSKNLDLLDPQAKERASAIAKERKSSDEEPSLLLFQRVSGAILKVMKA